jgi:hypothetical protein
MVSQCVFEEAVDILTRDPTSSLGVQMMHILMTGGPATTVEAARAKVLEVCGDVVVLLTP